MQIQWSDQTGQHSYGGGWAVDLMSHAGFTYQSTGSWGKAIFAEKGNLPKELTREGLAPVRSMPLRFSFDLPRELVTSITLIDAKGDRVRNLIAAQSRPGGRVTESWDGLDNVRARVASRRVYLEGPVPRAAKDSLCAGGRQLGCTQLQHARRKRGLGRRLGPAGRRLLCRPTGPAGLGWLGGRHGIDRPGVLPKKLVLGRGGRPMCVDEGNRKGRERML